MSTAQTSEQLAILGGPRAVTLEVGDLFRWPMVTEEDEQAVLEVLRAGTMSGVDVTKRFEQEYAAFQGTEYALGYCNGTAALLGAMFGCKIGRGDEIIAPSLTYWASVLPVFQLGGTVVFADIDPNTLCIDPADIEHRIGPRTKAIVVVHYCGHPADMDPIMAIAKRHSLKVIEDVSHAQGTLYRGRLTGAIGDVAAISLMAGKALPAGEAGMLCTDDREIYERAAAFGHYERHVVVEDILPLPADLDPWGWMPLGGVKHRMNQTCAAMGRVQLKHYPERIAEIQQAMNYFWDGLEGVPGLRAHRPPKDSGSTMGGWYNPLGHYLPEEVGGVPAARFMEAVSAEGGQSWRRASYPMHLQPLLSVADIYGDGRPTRIAFAEREVREGPGSLPVTEALVERCIGVPYFKHYRREQIDQFIAAYRKVAVQADKLQ